MKCVCCDTELSYVFADGEDEYQYDNALWIGFYGGYGMFTDEMSPSRILNAQHEVVLCHDCAHDLVESLPWMRQVIDPHTSHAHRAAYKADHPDHKGWDYDPAFAENSDQVVVETDTQEDTK